MTRIHREWNLNCKVYVGNLGENVSKYEVEHVFNQYGKVKNVWIAPNPPGYAFVEFEDEKDAENAARSLDGSQSWRGMSSSLKTPKKRERSGSFKDKYSNRRDRSKSRERRHSTRIKEGRSLSKDNH